MFDTKIEYKFVQRNRNKTNNESFIFQYIYRFFIHKGSSKRKYIVEVKEYRDKLFTIDYYAKTENPYKYRIRTNQFVGGKIGGTVLAIMAEVIDKYQVKAFGIAAAPLIEEDDDAFTKRFRAYTTVLRRKVDERKFGIFVIGERSHIFVIRNDVKEEREFIIDLYGQIFSEIY